MTTTEMHKGRDVIATRLKLTNAGDGLSNAMKIEPLERDLDYGDRVLVLVEAVVVKDEYASAVKGELNGPLAHCYTLRAEHMKLTTSATSAREMDKFKGKVNRANEIEGQRSIEEEIEQDGDV